VKQFQIQPRTQGPLSSSLEKVLSRGRKREDPGYEVVSNLLDVLSRSFNVIGQFMKILAFFCSQLAL